jgi:2-haloacid dehalogenase
VIHHIVFDVGNVLLLWDRDRPYRELIPDEAERRRFMEEICTMEWHAGLDEGVGIDDAIAELSQKFPEAAAHISSYKSRWLDTLPGAIEGTVEILHGLVEKGHDVTALTNFNQDLFRLTVPAYPFLNLFRGSPFPASGGW